MSRMEERGLPDVRDGRAIRSSLKGARLLADAVTRGEKHN